MAGRYYQGKVIPDTRQEFQSSPGLMAGRYIIEEAADGPN